MRILAFDASLTGFASAVRRENGEITLREAASRTTATAARDRVGRYNDLLNEVLPAAYLDLEPSGILPTPPIKVDLALIEGYSYASNNPELYELGILLRAHLVQSISPQADIIEVAPMTLKKFCGGHGGADKVAVASALTKRFGVEFKSSNESDAYGLCRLGELIVWVRTPITDDNQPPAWATKDQIEIATRYRDGPIAAKPAKAKKPRKTKESKE